MRILRTYTLILAPHTDASAICAAIRNAPGIPHESPRDLSSSQARETCTEVLRCGSNHSCPPDAARMLRIRPRQYFTVPRLHPSSSATVF